MSMEVARAVKEPMKNERRDNGTLVSGLKSASNEVAGGGKGGGIFEALLGLDDTNVAEEEEEEEGEGEGGPNVSEGESRNGDSDAQHGGDARTGLIEDEKNDSSPATPEDVRAEEEMKRSFYRREEAVSIRDQSDVHKLPDGLSQAFLDEIFAGARFDHHHPQHLPPHLHHQGPADASDAAGVGGHQLHNHHQQHQNWHSGQPYSSSNGQEHHHAENNKRINNNTGQMNSWRSERQDGWRAERTSKDERTS